MAQYREDQFRWTVIAGGINLGEADTKSGGSYGSEATTYFGPDGKQRQLGGRQTVENTTFTFAMTTERWAQVPSLKALRGKGANVSFSGQPKNADHAGEGATVTENGVLEEVNVPDYDASSDDAGYLEIVVAVNA